MTLREIQLYKLGILEDIAAICDKNGIKYILHYGTLLGAIRHDGYIPWDDDVDIAVPWNDYNKLIEIINKEYSEKYFVQNMWTNKNLPIPGTQIRVNGTTCMPVKQASYDIHWGMCIDIFVLVATETDEKKRLKRQKNINFAMALLEDDYRKMMQLRASGRRQKLINMIPDGIRHRIIDAIVKKYAHDPEENGLVSPLTYPEIVYQYSDILVTEKHVFEGKEFSIPKGYDKVLKIEYGDYMKLPPEDQRGGHDLALGEIINDVNKDYKEYQAELLNR